MNEIIIKGTTCYGSKKGYYNFYYPDFDIKYELAMNVEVKDISWIGTGEYRAVKVVSPDGYLPVNVLWVKR